MNFEETLKQANLRRTQGRLAILRIIGEAEGPLTQEQIAEKLGQGRLNKTNIYRALADFVAAGIVHEAFIKDRVQYYELGHRCSDRQCHPHFTCRDCGESFCMPEVELPLAKGLREGFVLQRQQVKLEGLCPDCG